MWLLFIISFTYKIGKNNIIHYFFFFLILYLPKVYDYTLFFSVPNSFLKSMQENYPEKCHGVLVIIIIIIFKISS